MRRAWLLWSKPPCSAMQASSASSPVCPNGVWPRSWPSATASARSSSSLKRPGERARDLRHLDGVGEAGAEMIALVIDEHLGLVGEAAEGGRMDDPVAVALELGARRRRRLGDEAPRRAGRIGGVGSASRRSGLVRHSGPLTLRSSPGVHILRQAEVLAAPASRRKRLEGHGHERSRLSRPRGRLDQRQRGAAAQRHPQGRGRARRSGSRSRAAAARASNTPSTSTGPAPTTTSRSPATGRRVLVDPVSLELLKGAELDFVDDLMGQSFRVKNPNAVASCGCGVSFSV